MLASTAMFGSYDWATWRSAGTLHRAARNAVIDMLHGSSVSSPSPSQLWTCRAVPDRVAGSSDSSSTASCVSATTGGTSASSDANGSRDSTGTSASADGAGRSARTATVVQPAVAAISATIARACQKFPLDGPGGGPGRRTGP